MRLPFALSLHRWPSRLTPPYSRPSRNSLLSKGLVQKLTVVNHSRVVITLHSAAASPVAAPASVWDAGAMTPSGSNGGSSLPAPPSTGGSANQTPYYFTIGSPEAFERSLEADQDALGVPLSQRVPVQYKSASSWWEWGLSLAPTALLVGVIVWSTRKAMPGGAGGGGGPGGIFGVGKSKAKMFKCVIFPCTC